MRRAKRTALVCAACLAMAASAAAQNITAGVKAGFVLNSVPNAGQVIDQISGYDSVDVSAKAGLIGFTKATAREVASRGIGVNAVAPGFIETDMTAAMTAKAREAIVGAVPMARVGTAEDVAPAVVFLLSEAAAYITGQVLSVDGGFHM